VRQDRACGWLESEAIRHLVVDEPRALEVRWIEHHVFDGGWSVMGVFRVPEVGQLRSGGFGSALA
jgi:hypothetical protein